MQLETDRLKNKTSKWFPTSKLEEEYPVKSGRFVCGENHPMPNPTPEGTLWMHPDSSPTGKWWGDPLFNHVEHECPHCKVKFAVTSRA